MASYLDPTAYMFYFFTLSDTTHEPRIKAIARDLMAPFQEIALRYAGFGQGFNGLTGVWLNHLTAPGPSVDTPNRGLTPKYDSLSEAEDYYQTALETLKDERCRGITVDAYDRYNRRHFLSRPTKLGKEYMAWQGKQKKTADFLENKAYIHSIYDCPSDDLSEVTMPLFFLAMGPKFVLDYGCWTWGQYKDDFALPLSPEEAGCLPYFHYISLIIPRYLIGQSTDTLPMQRQWTEALAQLGEWYPRSVGSISFCPAFYIGGPFCGFSPYDSAWGTTYRADRIPGYAWAMLINASQKSRLPDNWQEKGKSEFHRMVEMENGSVFFQKTPDVRYMTYPECRALHRFFEASLPDVKVDIVWGQLTHTLRLGFSPDEITLPSGVSCSLVGIQHQAAK